MTAKTLIPRKVLFGNPDRAQPRLSPDGKQIAYLSSVNNVLNVWVAPVDNLAAARAITNDTVRGIRFFAWLHTNAHILYIQDKGGDENWHAYVVEVATGAERDLTPYEGVNAQPQEPSADFPNEVMIGMNDRMAQLHDLYRVNIHTGERTLVQENPGFAAFSLDEQWNVRFGLAMGRDGGITVLKPNNGDWTPAFVIPAEDTLTTELVSFSADGQTIYAVDSRGRDTAAFVAMNADDYSVRVLAADPRADCSHVLRHPSSKAPQAVAFTYARKEWQVLDSAIADDLERLRNVADGDIDVVSRTEDDLKWIVAYLMDNGPVRYYLYDRATKAATFLFTNLAALEGLPLSKMHPAVVPARDGLNMVCYYTLPYGSDTKNPGVPDSPVPLVLLVHGGPWARDSWGYSPIHQWLANRGYAVLSVNYRASTGFGKHFINAGNLEWGGKMHTDLLDAVEWAIQKGLTTRSQVAVMGGSYGGYATLASLTLTPDVFACGVDIVGPSNLITLIESVPPYWEPMIAIFRTRMGDNTTEEGRKLLTERSPLTHVSSIRRPLLIGQGANDPRVKQPESDQIVKAMQEKGIPVTYALFPDEGHGFARPENRLAFFAAAESFLSTHLEGEYEPIGSDLTNSSMQIVTGKEGVPGL